MALTNWFLSVVDDPQQMIPFRYDSNPIHPTVQHTTYDLGCKHEGDDPQVSCSLKKSHTSLTRSLHSLDTMEYMCDGKTTTMCSDTMSVCVCVSVCV